MMCVGPPDHVSNLTCHFVKKNIMHVTFIAPITLDGTLTHYNIEFVDLIHPIITNGTSYNIIINNSINIDLFREYIVNVTSFNNGGVGKSSICTIVLPNGK